MTTAIARSTATTATAPACVEEEGPAFASCSDGKDNDGDGLIDCAEGACLRNPRVWECARPEVCNDGYDNDSDGPIDGEDEDCP
jgi:hypothetical protein